MTIRGFRLLRGASPLFLLVIPLLRLGAQQIPTVTGPLVQGAVTAEESGMPLETANVTLFGADGEEILTVFTDERGRFSLRAPAAGSYRMRAGRLGYHPRERGPFTLQTTDTLTLDFQLSPAPLLLDSILVNVRRQGRTIGAGEQLVYGRLLDSGSDEPIPQGMVQLLSESRTAATTLSNDDGLFWLVSPRAGTYRLRAERIGYFPSEGPEFRLMLGDTIGVNFHLSVEAVELAPMVITATSRPLGSRYDLTGMEGFLQRYAQFSRSGFGEFMIRDSIASYEGRATSTGHLMAMKFLSVRQVISEGSRYGQVILRGVTAPTGFGAPGVCFPTYFMDGTEVPQEAVLEGQINPISMYPPEMLEGVEVYVQPNIPAEFLRGTWPCGVVALWTRRDPGAPGSGIPGWKKFLAGFVLVTLALLASR